jgi:N-acetylneuraminic acid mutarotase
MPDARGSSAVGVYAGKIYLAGGMTLLQAYKGGTQNSQATVSSYDTETDTWDTNYPPLPEPRQHVGYSVVGSAFYVIGGREDGIYHYHNTTYAMDLENPTHWTILAPMPTARGSLPCAPIGHKIYCFGGEGNRENPDRVFNETQVYDTISDTWKNLKPMGVPRHGFGVAAVGDRIYVPGGGVTTAFYPTGINDVYVPDLEE